MKHYAFMKGFSIDRSFISRTRGAAHWQLLERLHLSSAARPVGGDAAIFLPGVRPAHRLVRQYSFVQLSGSAARPLPELRRAHSDALSGRGALNSRLVLLRRLYARPNVSGYEVLRLLRHPDHAGVFRSGGTHFAR